MTVQEIAASVAADIRKYGHYQSRMGQKLWDSESGQCCVLYNPTADDVLKCSWVDWKNFTTVLRYKVHRNDIIIWQDQVSTQELLTILDEISGTDQWEDDGGSLDTRPEVG